MTRRRIHLSDVDGPTSCHILRQKKTFINLSDVLPGSSRGASCCISSFCPTCCPLSDWCLVRNQEMIPTVDTSSRAHVTSTCRTVAFATKQPTCQHRGHCGCKQPRRPTGCLHGSRSSGSWKQKCQRHVLTHIKIYIYLFRYSRYMCKYTCRYNMSTSIYIIYVFRVFKWTGF